MFLHITMVDSILPTQYFLNKLFQGVCRKNLHQNHPYYYYPSMQTHPNTRMSPHPHQNMPPHIYPIIPPHQVCLHPYCTSTPMYVPYVVPHYPHIPSLGYLHIISIILPYSVLPTYSSKNISKYRNKSRNIR